MTVTRNGITFKTGTTMLGVDYFVIREVGYIEPLLKIETDTDTGVAIEQFLKGLPESED